MAGEEVRPRCSGRAAAPTAKQRSKRTLLVHDVRHGEAKSFHLDVGRFALPAQDGLLARLGAHSVARDVRSALEQYRRPPTPYPHTSGNKRNGLIPSLAPSKSGICNCTAWMTRLRLLNCS